MSLQQFLLTLRARWWLASSVLGVFLAGALVLNVAMPRKFSATAEVVVDAKSDPMATEGQEHLPTGFAATQVDIIASDRVARRAATILRFDQDAHFREEWQDATGGRGDPAAWIGDELKEHISVDPSHDSGVIEITANWNDGKTAALVANAFAQAYIDTTVELKVDPAKQNTRWFDDRIQELRTDLEKKQKLLSDFESEKSITANDEHLDIENARLSDLSAQLTAVQGERQNNQSRQRQAGADNETSPEIIQNPLIVSLKAELARAETHLHTVATELGTKHPSYLSARSEVESLRQRLKEESSRIQSSIAAAAQVDEGREEDLRRALETQKQRVLEAKHDRERVDTLRSDVATTQHSLEDVSQRLAQASLQSQAQHTDAQLLSPAAEPMWPSAPRKLLNLLAGLFLGTLSGIAAALLCEFVDPRIRGDEQLIALLGVPILGKVGFPGGSLKVTGRGIAGNLPLASE